MNNQLQHKYEEMRVKPTWNSYQWFMKTPDIFRERMGKELAGISKEAFGHKVLVEVSDMEILAEPYSPKRYLRFYVYIKGHMSPNSYAPLARYVAENLGEGIWGMNRGMPPVWADNGNEYVGCTLRSPFLVVQFGKYVGRGTTGYDGFFDALEEGWDSVGDHRKLYFDELRAGNVNWMRAGNLLDV